MSDELADSIAEQIQAPIRKRLQLIRESKKLAKTEVKVVFPDTIRRWEEEDISSMKLSALKKLADRYGIDFIDFIKYLFISDSLVILDPGQQYYASLPDTYKEAATEVMRSLHSLSVKAKLAG